MYRLRSWSSKNRGDICDSGFSGSEDAKIQLGVSARCRKDRLRMQNFCGRYLQGVERADRGCKIFAGSILRLSKTWDVDARFAKEVSLNPRKDKM